jgi:hypothetical protein
MVYKLNVLMFLIVYDLRVFENVDWSGIVFVFSVHKKENLYSYFSTFSEEDLMANCPKDWTRNTSSAICIANRNIVRH